MNPIPINPIQSNEAERSRVDEMAARRNAARPDVRSALRDEAERSREADFIKERISSQLGPAAAEMMTALKPTCELRWLDRGRDYMRSLQQRWACALTGKSEWRDVPVVME